MRASAPTWNMLSDGELRKLSRVQQRLKAGEVGEAMGLLNELIAAVEQHNSPVSGLHTMRAQMHMSNGGSEKQMRAAQKDAKTAIR